tara:strand:+ start:21870 stop:22781 length:912 start_codon:yes stop_codon:yes gene_type:complete
MLEIEKFHSNVWVIMSEIVVAIDNNVVAPLCVLLNSLRIQNPHSAFKIHVLQSDLSAHNRQTLLDHAANLKLPINMVNVDAEPLVRVFGRMNSGHVSHVSLFRCMIGSLLDETITKVLYLDIDTLVLGSIVPIFNIDLGGNIVAVVREEQTYLAEFGVKPQDYFNTGVMLIDLKKWRSENVEARLMEILNRYPEKLQWWDQSALNIALKGKTLSMNRRYNYIESRPKTGEKIIIPTILHFAGSCKPWIEPDSHAWGAAYCNASIDTPWTVDYLARGRADAAAYRKKNWFHRSLVRFGRKLSRI